MSHTRPPYTVETRNIPIVDTGDYEGYLCVRGPDGRVIYERFGDDEQDQDNAEFIVRACNAHDDLLAACKKAAIGIEAATATGAAKSYGLVAVQKVLLAAIAKAKGKA